MKILCKDTISAAFQTNRLRLCRKCVFSTNGILCSHEGRHTFFCSAHSLDNKRLCVLEQTYRQKMKVCLSTYDLLLPPGIVRLNLYFLKDSGTHGFISSVFRLKHVENTLFYNLKSVSLCI